MAQRAILRARSNNKLLPRAAEFLSGRAGSSEIVVLAPTRAAANELALLAFPRGCQGVHALTLPQLAASLAAEPLGRQSLAPISRLGTEALSASIVQAAQHAESLPYFSPVAQMPGFARAAAKTLSELRLENVDPAELASTGAPGRDLAHLLHLYEQELEKRSLADFAVLLRLASAEVSQNQHRFTGLPLVLLDLPLESQSYQKFLAALIEKSPAVLATAITGDEAKIESLEKLLGTTAENLDEEAPATTLDRVRTWLFSNELPPSSPPDPDLLFSAPGESLECVEIARRIRALALSTEGFAFDRVAILLRNVEQYQPLLEEALRRAAIPGYFSRGVARPDPAGRAFLALLACAAEGCSASRFAEYLSLGQLPPVDESGAPQKHPPLWVPPDDDILGNFSAPPPSRQTAMSLSAMPSTAGASPMSVVLSEQVQPSIPATAFAAASEATAAPPAATSPSSDTGAPAFAIPAGWEKLLVDAAVIGGPERWARRLAGLRAELEAQLRDLDREDESHRPRIERRIQQLICLEHFSLPLIQTLSGLPVSANWGDWLAALSDLASVALRRPESVLSVLNELEPMSAVGPASLHEVYDVLSEKLGMLRTEPAQRRYGAVFIGSIEEARGRNFDIVFLPGLAEGLFPRRALEDPLLLDAHRAKISSSILDKRSNRVAEERMLLRSAAAAAHSQLVVSYPRMDVAQSRARVPSFYALEVVRAAEGRLPSLHEFEKRAARAAPSRLDWPAPSDPNAAIDDAEYDLAALRLARAPGSARYLMEVNQHLARSFRTRWRRWESRWSSADGLLYPDELTRKVLAGELLSKRSYSPSTLQQFAACPYRFFLQGVLQLRPREAAVPLEQMDPLTRGAVFHSIQFEFFRALAEAGLLPVTAGNLPGILDLADQVLNRVAARFEEDLAPAIPRVWRSEIESLRSDLRGWLQQTAASEAEWIPIHFEFGFGLPPDPHRDPESTRAEAVILDGIRLRGSIDLIERHATRDVLRVTDHKTGKPPQNHPRYVGGGTTLQPLLYALAAQGLLGQPVESGRLFFCTQRGDFLDLAVRLDQDASDRLARVLEIINHSIQEGFLPAAPQSGACVLCDYKSACGPYEETRVKRKQPGALDALVELRGTP